MQKFCAFVRAKVNKDWVHTYYSDLLSQTLKELDIANYRLEWEIEETKLPEDFLDEDEEGEFFFEKQKPASNTIGFNFMENPFHKIRAKNENNQFC